MISTIAVHGYRSLRELRVPLARITVVTGANGTGKSSLYRALRLLADCAEGQVIASLAREGGLPSTLWAGPETISKHVRSGEYEVEGTLRSAPVSLQLGFAADEFSYLIDLGIPIRTDSAFNLDPEINRELVWADRSSGRPPCWSGARARWSSSATAAAGCRYTPSCGPTSRR
jgi:predicted ATPase